MILSDIVELKKTNNYKDIESFLQKKFLLVVRWAIIEVKEKTIKISVTYKN